MLERVWAGWRSAFIGNAERQRDSAPNGDGTLFERILAGDDDEALGVVHRGELVSVILNAYPYGSGHLLVVPNRGVARLSDLSPEESRELWDTVQHAVGVIEASYTPHGINVGLNQGRAGGASVPDHLHVHVLPRWDADTSFITSIAESRVLPEPLEETGRKLRAQWSTVQ